MGRASEFIPSVFFRRYALHFAIFAAAIAVYIFVFAFFAKETAASCAEIYRFNHTTCREIVIASSDPKPDGDTFYCLNGTLVSGSGKRLFCDVYMTKEGVSYRDNAVLFDGTLNSGDCLISRNVAAENGLAVGDEIALKDKTATYRIAGFLMPQSGLDGRYDYDGVILLSYSADLAAGANYANLSGELDSYYGKLSNTFLRRLKEKAVGRIAVAAAISAAAYLVLFAVCEYFLFSPRYSDYVLMNNEGLPCPKLFARIILDNFVKFVLPLLLTAAGFAASLGYYGGFYYLSAAIFFGFAAILSGAYSLLVLGRLTKCHKIREA